MWAFETGKSSPEVIRQLVYYKMLSEFGLEPERVNKMTGEDVETMLYLSFQEKKKQRQKSDLSSLINNHRGRL